MLDWRSICMCRRHVLRSGCYTRPESVYPCCYRFRYNHRYLVVSHQSALCLTHGQRLSLSAQHKQYPNHSLSMCQITGQQLVIMTKLLHCAASCHFVLQHRVSHSITLSYPRRSTDHIQALLTWTWPYRSMLRRQSRLEAQNVRAVSVKKYK